MTNISLAYVISLSVPRISTIAMNENDIPVEKTYVGNWEKDIVSEFKDQSAENNDSSDRNFFYN